MTNNEMVLELLELIGPDPRQNCILKGAIRQLLKPDAAPKQHEPEAEAVRADVKAVQDVREPASDKAASEPKKRGRKSLDMGKCRALLKAGWSIAKCADELGVSEPTLRKRLKEEGLLK